MVDVSITSIGVVLCLFGLSLIIFLLLPRENRETTVPGPDRPASTQTFLTKLREKGFGTFLRGLHAQYGGMTAFYFNHRLIFSIEDEEVISKNKPIPIPVIQHFRNFKLNKKGMERQRFRQVRKWFDGEGRDFIEKAIRSSCSTLNSIWRKMETNDKAQLHISALSMQISAQSFCGITDLQKLTELRHAADEILDAINDSIYTDDSTDSLEHVYADFDEKVNSISPNVGGSLRESIPSGASEFLLSAYWTLNVTIGGLLHKTNVNNLDQTSLMEASLDVKMLPWTCAIQDAGLSIHIGNHNIPNDAIMLTYFSQKNKNLDCWSQYPVGIFSICSPDASLWGADILMILSFLTSGLSISPKTTIAYEGDFLKQPKNFTTTHTDINV